MFKALKLRGAYGKVTAWMKKKQVYTRTEVVDFTRTLGKSEAGCSATATVMLSPRLTSSRGDCRGNMSNPWGHLAYNDKLPRKAKSGVKEEQKFRFRYRKEAMEPNSRYTKVKIEAKKVATKAVTKTKTKTKAKSEAKVKAKAK
jgi:hypothetical protein